MEIRGLLRIRVRRCGGAVCPQPADPCTRRRRAGPSPARGGEVSGRLARMGEDVYSGRRGTGRRDERRSGRPGRQWNKRSAVDLCTALYIVITAVVGTVLAVEGAVSARDSPGDSAFAAAAALALTA